MAFTRSRNPNRKAPIAEWIEEHVVIPHDNANPGPLKLRPYQRGIIEALDDEETTQCSMMVYSQMGKTLITFGYIFWALEHGIRGVFAMPSQDLMMEYIRKQVQPMLDVSPHINKLVSRTNRGQISKMGFDGPTSSFIFRTSTSKAGFINATAQVCLADEIDRYTSSNDTNNPLDPLRSRGQTYDKFLLVCSSTPGQKGASWIEREWKRGSREEWFVPCPECEEWRCWGFGDVRRSEETGRWTLFCPDCDHAYDETERLGAVFSGEWRATNPEAHQGHRSFHLSEICSPDSTIEETWSYYNPEDTRGFMTQRMAEPYDAVVYEPMDARQVMELRRARPDESLRLCRTVGVDPAPGMLDVQVVDFYRQEGSERPLMFIDEHYKILRRAEDGYNESWAKVYETLDDDLGRLKPDMVFVDVGNNGSMSGAEVVLGWAVTKAHPEIMKLHRDGRFVPIKGQGAGTQTRLIIGDKRFEPKSPVWQTLTVYSGNAKDVLYPMLSESINKPDKAVVAVHEDISRFSQGFAVELVGSYELVMYRKQGGVESPVWNKLRSRREGFDCFEYCFLAWIYLGERARPREKVMATRAKLKEIFG